MLTPAFSQSLITFDVDTTKFTPGEIVELHGTVQSGLEGEVVAVEIKDADGTLILIRTVTSDGNGEFTSAMGMSVAKSNLGFGQRSWRYAAIINNCKIEKIFEEPGKSDNYEEDPYGETSPENVLSYLQK